MKDIGACTRDDCISFSNKWSNNCSAIQCYVAHSGILCPFFKTKDEDNKQKIKLRDKGHWVTNNFEEYAEKIEKV